MSGVVGPVRATECAHPVHDWPMPRGYIGASSAAAARLRARWQNPQCPDCGVYGWIPSSSKPEDTCAVHAPAGHGPHMLVSNTGEYGWCGGLRVCRYCAEDEPQEFPDSDAPHCPCGCSQLWSDEFHMWLCPHCDIGQSDSGQQIRKGDC